MSKRLNFLLALSLTAYALPGSADPFFGVSDDRPQGNGANSAFFDDKERGWFWYERPPEPESAPADAAPEPAAKPAPKPSGAPLSSAWFRKNLTRFRDAAVDNPSPDNVSRYLYLQRVMLDKAERFTDASQLAVMKDPVIDENSRRPIASFGARLMDEQADSGKNAMAKKLADTAGLWFFFSSTCNFCVKEAGVLQGLSRAYGFKVLAISLDGLPLPGGAFPDFTADQGQGKRLGVNTTPALFLVKPGSDPIQLSQGLLSGTEIVQRAITLAHDQGWITDQENDMTKPVVSAKVEVSALQSIDENTLMDPARFVEAIRSHLRAHRD